MKNYILFGLLISFGFLKGQETTADKKSQLAQGLAYVATGNTFSSVGNYVALSTASNTLTASMFFLGENDDMYSVNIKAGATQGISTLFNQGELNSDVSLGGEYRWVLKDRNNLITKNLDQERVIAKQEAAAKAAYKLAIGKLVEATAKLRGDSEFKSEEELDFTKKVDAEVKVLEVKVSAGTITKGERARLSVLKKLKQEYENETNPNVDNYFSAEVNRLATERDAKIAASKVKRNALKASFINLTYLSFGYKATNSSFVRFVDSLPVADQLIKDDYTSQSIGMSYNYTSNVSESTDGNGKKSWIRGTRKYLSIGAFFDYTNNISSLTQVEVLDDKTIANGDAERIVRKKQNAFQGDYDEDINNLTAFIDYYRFFGKEKDAIALHLNPTMKFVDDKKPVSQFLVGVVIPFKKADKQSIITNIELFYRIKDVFNTTENKNSLLNRNVIGVQTTFPFNF